MLCDQRCNCYVAEYRCCGCAVVGDWAFQSKCLVATDEDQLTGRSAVLSTKRIVSLISNSRPHQS